MAIAAGNRIQNVATAREDLGPAHRRRHGLAAAVIPDEMVLGTTLIGTAAMVRDRLAGWAAVGVDTVRLYPAGDTVDARLDTLGRALELVPD